jgi:hypothetical protein
VARFAVPAGTAAGLGVLAAYQFSLSVVEAPPLEARTVATSVLVLVGLFLVLALEASERRRGRNVLALCLALLFAYMIVLVWGWSREFFELSLPGPWEVIAIIGGTALAVAGLIFTDERFVPRV